MCENETDEDLKKKNGFVTNVKIKVLMFSVYMWWMIYMNDYLIN